MKLQYELNRAQMRRNRAEKGCEHPLGDDFGNVFAHGLCARCPEDVPAAGFHSDGVADGRAAADAKLPEAEVAFQSAVGRFDSGTHGVLAAELVGLLVAAPDLQATLGGRMEHSLCGVR